MINDEYTFREKTLRTNKNKITVNFFHADSQKENAQQIWIN